MPATSETGRFWVLSGAFAWNEAARELLVNKPLTLAESARLFAHINIALADAFLAIFAAKYHYGFWRPITAIRNGDRDGNNATERDPGWTPLIATPLHPEYPCAHCVCDGAAGAVLKSVFGTGNLPEFTLTYAAMSGVTRKYTSIQQLEDEVAMARIWVACTSARVTKSAIPSGGKSANTFCRTTCKPFVDTWNWRQPQCLERPSFCDEDLTPPLDWQ